MGSGFRRFATFCAIAAIPATIGCSANTEVSARAARGAGASATVPVTTAIVEKKAMPLTLDVIGTAEAFSSVTIRAQITGALTSVGFNEGDDVAADQVLFTLDRRPLEAALRQAQAALERDTAQAAQANATAARTEDLQARGIATKEQADQSRTAVLAIEATLQADRAAVENALVQLQYATIAAPISGRTGALMVHAGNLVRANDTTPLVVINQVAPIYVSFGIPESRLPELRRYLSWGTIRVQAAAPGETELSTGAITFIDNAVDSTTGQIKIKAEFPNNDRRLWPGQFANVTLALSTEPNAIVVPTAAVQNGPQGTYVFTVSPDMTAEQRPVTVARQNADMTVIEGGLTPNEVVVTDGHLRLVPGTKVSVKGGPSVKAAEARR